MCKQRHFFNILLFLVSFNLAAQQTTKIFPGADEKTPSRSEYFSWINNTNEGATEKQTLINLDFFKWLNRSFGMKLDIYAFDAGAIDGAGYYGSTTSDKFNNQFPNGFSPMYIKAKEINTRLGLWGGPDGFGNNPEEEKARTDLMISLCRDYEFELFKFDGVCGRLRDDKQPAFINMMIECRKFKPDLILLNHRLNLGDEGVKHATTYLMGGAETYIDVHFPNNQTAPHHRAGALSRNLVPRLSRLTEDHGVCLSSCLNYWEDELILQAFNRNLILAPQLYGSPWFLKDEEYPKLARIFNLTRKYKEILVDGMVLPKEKYGEKAVSRGDDNTRLITLRNMSWEPKTYTIKLDEEIGLLTGNKIELRMYHPYEKIIGEFERGEEINIEVLAFRSCLLKAGPAKNDEIAIMGLNYEIIKDIPEEPIIIKLLGMPGSQIGIKLKKPKGKIKTAVIDGENYNDLLKGKLVDLKFPGISLAKDYHRKLGELKAVNLPDDAEALYEATIYSADNNALEVRSLQRSGETKISQVSAAREAFINQDLFVDRGLWDKYMFDGDMNTSFYKTKRFGDQSINRGSLRIDFGELLKLDKFIIYVKDEHSLSPFKSQEAVRGQISADLENWEDILFLAGKKMTIKLDPDKPIRYIRLRGTPDRVFEVEAYYNGKVVDRSKWRGSNLFSQYSRISGKTAWQNSFVLDEIPDGSYLAIALNGKHGTERAYAAIRVDGKVVGASDRAVSYPSNTWEYPVSKKDSNYTYYIPLTKDMIGKKIDAVVIGMRNVIEEFKSEVWITAYPIPFEEIILILN